ncbi:MAG: rhodoquinone biosynthesis methyltransferase RquA [Alphaproteobacteria bacterium]
MKFEPAEAQYALEQNRRRSAPSPAAALTDGTASRRAEGKTPDIPAYLSDTYDWAYINPRNVRLLDRELVVASILWGQHHRLQRAAFSEILPGQSVLQATSVYGSFLPALARHIGPKGQLQVLDVAPVQVERCRQKLHDFPNATVRLADAAEPSGEHYDAVSCYFLLHEVPTDYKHRIVDAMLDSIVPGGKVIFVDYHRPHFAHPLKLITSVVFDTLEPFAKSLWDNAIADYASTRDDFAWTKQTFFGGLFQKVTASRPAASSS